MDALLGRRKEIEHEVSISMKTEFMSLWDGLETNSRSKVIVMGATNRPGELDAAVKRRSVAAHKSKFACLRFFGLCFCDKAAVCSGMCQCKQVCCHL